MHHCKLQDFLGMYSDSYPQGISEPCHCPPKEPMFSTVFLNHYCSVFLTRPFHLVFYLVFLRDLPSISLSEMEPRSLVCFSMPLIFIQMILVISDKFSLFSHLVWFSVFACIPGIASGSRAPKDTLFTLEQNRLHKSITLCTFKERTVSSPIFFSFN